MFIGELSLLMCYIVPDITHFTMDKMKQCILPVNELSKRAIATFFFKASEFCIHFIDMFFKQHYLTLRRTLHLFRLLSSYAYICKNTCYVFHYPLDLCATYLIKIKPLRLEHLCLREQRDWSKLITYHK